MHKRTDWLLYGLIFIFALGIRLWLNFSSELVPGVNGGYYPLQVRALLNTGQLAFSDMPLLFYLDAFLIRTVSLFGIPVSDRLILTVVKIVDSLSIPLIVIPLFRISRATGLANKNHLQAGILLFSVLSISPLVLTSDLQKNALAVLFLFFVIAFFLDYAAKKEKTDPIFAGLFLLLTGLTHFGTFVFAVLFLCLSVLFLERKKATIPLIVTVVAGGFVIALFDMSRLSRVLSFWNVLFERPALLHGMLFPLDFLNIGVSISLVLFAIFTFKKARDRFSSVQKAVLFSSILCLLILSFPMLDGEYFKRLSLFLFIPQVLLILQIWPYLTVRQLNMLSTGLILLATLSVAAFAGRPKEVVITKAAYEELKELGSVVRSDPETILIARHGLEWWTAWALNMKVGQDKAIDAAFFQKYRNVFFIYQVNGFGDDIERTRFHEPTVPPNAERVFSKHYFQVCKVSVLP